MNNKEHARQHPEQHDDDPTNEDPAKGSLQLRFKFLLGPVRRWCVLPGFARLRYELLVLGSQCSGGQVGKKGEPEEHGYDAQPRRFPVQSTLRYRGAERSRSPAGASNANRGPVQRGVRRLTMREPLNR